MTDHESDPDPTARRSAVPFPVDPSLVLVVSRTPVNRIVVTRIAERCGFRTIAADPAEAPDLLSRALPGVVILDGGGDNRDCDGLVDDLAFRRAGLGGASPAVIFLATATDLPEGLAMAAIVDAVVAKPITPEGLQPTILRLTDRLRAAV